MVPDYISEKKMLEYKIDKNGNGNCYPCIEFSTSPYSFIIKPGQEYRIDDERYSKNVKYHWLTINDNSDVKIYHQMRTVAYADYLPDKYYVSVHEVLVGGK